MEALIDRLYDLFIKCPIICTDSRKIVPGCLFFGLLGDHVDGSVFGTSAINLGASCAVVRVGTCEERPGIFYVNDPLEVLQNLAERHRKELTIPVIGITGSNGKTTTKELICRVLSSAYSVGATHGNLNNHIGVPLTVLSISSTDQIAIVEMGANHSGEIKLLCQIARPTHGIVTNIGKAHLEGFGSLEGVKRAKSELYESLSQSGGIAFVNLNEDFLMELSARVSHRVYYRINDHVEFGSDRYSFVTEQSSFACTIGFVDARNIQWKVTSSLFGAFNLANIATAVAVGLYFEISGDKICDALATYSPDNNRAQRVEIASNTFILDAYNANPTSMTSSINSFASIAHPCKFMILGSMMELGEYSVAEHLEIAKRASSLTNTTTIFVGELFRDAADKYYKQWYPDVELLTKAFSKQLLQNALILIKGSRAMRLERLLTGFQ